MARTIRSAKLENRTARLKLKRGAFHSVSAGHPHTALQYRLPKGGGAGIWYVRVTSGKSHRQRKLGVADDYADADGEDVLDYYAAIRRAVEVADDIIEEARVAADPRRAPLTVAKAAEHYMTWFRANRRSVVATENVIQAHILPAFGDSLVAELTHKQIAGWHVDLAEAPARKRSRKGRKQAFKARPVNDDGKRGRRATANRILTVLKAILNHAVQNELVECAPVWRNVKPFGKVEAPRVRFLRQEEARRLVNACDADFRPLVQAALDCGARYGELRRALVEDFSQESRTLFIRYPKSGTPRHAYLTEQGVALIEELIRDKGGDEFIFTRADGEAWGPAQQTRRMHAASARAGVEPAAGFHVLRHTYAAALAMKGVPLAFIAAAIGDSQRITERHYAHLCRDHVGDAVRAALPDFTGFEPKDNVVPLETAR